MHLVVYDTHELPERAGHSLSEVLGSFAEDPILLLVSGGSALSLLSYIQPEVLGAHITLSVLDERAGDVSASNFRALAKTPFYKTAVSRGVSVIDTSVSKTDTANDVAVRMDTACKLWRAQNPAGRVIATFGIGEDGHTAGIMPFPENPPLFTEMFETDSALFVGYDAGAKSRFPFRATATFPFIRSIDAGVAFVSGEGKRTALESVLFRATLAYTPAAVLAHLPTVLACTDIRGLPVVE
jgi:6-phosphogluconolactonase/glucosamine-6-phosphate isomerase/deaminase